MAIRVLHALSTIASGGVEVQLLEVIRGLRPPEFEHRVICTATVGPIADEIRNLGVQIDETGTVDSIFSRSRYRLGIEIGRRWQPAIVHGGVMEGVLLAAVVGRRLGLPTIIEETSDPQNRRWKGHLLVRMAAASADRCLAISPAGGRYFADTLRVPGRKVVVVPYGARVPEHAERTDVRREVGIPDDAVVVGTVCRLFDDHKRVSDLIASMSTLMEERRRLHLLIVGEGPDGEVLRDQANRTGVGDRVHFTGVQIPPDRFYSAMDVFSLASSREGFGLVAAEAMHAGLPVVATAVGGLGEVVVDGETGLLVPPLARDDLATALRKLIDDERLRAKMGTASLARARSVYGQGRYLRDIADLYRAVA